jgi:type II secretory pathway pseudopilin PulG
MGQQQLLLLVLATVIVGIATVVGIQAFSQNSAKSNADALMNDAVRIASDAQAWAQKSAPFGGPATFGAAGFDEATFALLGYSSTNDGDDTTTDPNVYSNLNGDFILTPAANNLLITGTNPTLQNRVTVAVTGLTDDTVNGQVVCLSGEGTNCP